MYQAHDFTRTLFVKKPDLDVESLHEDSVSIVRDGLNDRCVLRKENSNVSEELIGLKTSKFILFDHLKLSTLLQEGAETPTRGEPHPFGISYRDDKVLLHERNLQLALPLLGAPPTIAALLTPINTVSYYENSERYLTTFVGSHIKYLHSSDIWER